MATTTLPVAPKFQAARRRGLPTARAVLAAAIDRAAARERAEFPEVVEFRAARAGLGRAVERAVSP